MEALNESRKDRISVTLLLRGHKLSGVVTEIEDGTVSISTATGKGMVPFGNIIAVVIKS